MNIGELIHNRRLELGLTLEQIGEAVGVGKSTVRKWETGYISNMRRDRISKLASILQLDPVDLVMEVPTNESYRVPIFDSLVPQKAIGNILTGIPSEISIESSYGTTCLALRIHGHAMEPYIFENDIVLFRPLNSICDILDGDILTIFGPTDDECCRKITRTSEGILLIPINPLYESKFFAMDQIKLSTDKTDDISAIRIYGKVIEIRRMLS